MLKKYLKDTLRIKQSDFIYTVPLGINEVINLINFFKFKQISRTRQHITILSLCSSAHYCSRTFLFYCLYIYCLFYLYIYCLYIYCLYIILLFIYLYFLFYIVYFIILFLLRTHFV